MRVSITQQHSFIQTQLKAFHESIFLVQKSYISLLPKELKHELYEFVNKGWIDKIRDNGLKILAEVEKKRKEELEKAKEQIEKDRN